MTLFAEGLPELPKPIAPLSLKDFVPDPDGVPRIVSWRLAEVLDFGRAANVHNLIERNRQTLECFGNLLHREVNYPGAGRPGREYLLNFNQAIFVVIKSEAPNAVPVQIHVVKIYGLWATGKLRPVDYETEATIAVETAQTFQQSPELMGLLQGLLERINDLATQNDVGEVGGRIASVQRTALEIQDRLSDIVKRRQSPVRNQDIYDAVVTAYYHGRCPCCMRDDRVIIENGARTKRYALDHATDNPYKNGLHEMWPVCRECNGKLTHDPRYRAETMDRFRVFQSHVAEVMGRRLI